MKNMDNYRWIIPSLIALGVILLSGGIFVGVKSYETLEANSRVYFTVQSNAHLRCSAHFCRPKGGTVCTRRTN